MNGCTIAPCTKSCILHPLTLPRAVSHQTPCTHCTVLSIVTRRHCGICDGCSNNAEGQRWSAPLFTSRRIRRIGDTILLVLHRVEYVRGEAAGHPGRRSRAGGLRLRPLDTEAENTCFRIHWRWLKFGAAAGDADARAGAKVDAHTRSRWVVRQIEC